MPSGLTHILLTKKSQDKITDKTLKNIFASGIYSSQIGAIAPDLPYASIADNDIFHNQKYLADDFHYKKNNQIPLQSLSILKKLNNSIDAEIHDQMFSFYLGYISHVFADGIIHPYIRDKIGDYKGNETAHRDLEMKLDVALLHYLTINSGVGFEINYTSIQDELLNFADEKGGSKIVETFNGLIKANYSENTTEKEVMGWIHGLHRLFSLATGDFPPIFRNFKGNTFTYKNFEDLDPDEVLFLRKPIDRNLNFLKTREISFFDNCLPQFFAKYVMVAQKAYEFIYNDGPILDEPVGWLQKITLTKYLSCG